MIGNWIKSRGDWFLKGSAHYFTLKIGRRYAKKFPMYFVVGFPRSGTSWLSDLVADYYNLPRPKQYYLPIAFPAVLHTHWPPHAKQKNTFYIYRDGRDTYASYFFYEKKYVQENPDSFYSQQFKKMWGDRMMDPAFEQDNFLKYLEWVFRNKNTWAAHINTWLKASKQNSEIVLIAYEDLLKDTYETLSQGIQQLDGQVNQEILEDIIEKNSFSKQMKRPTIQHKTPLRKGKKNSWKEVFNPESAKLFNEHCGEMLLKLNYAETLEWVHASPELVGK